MKRIIQITILVFISNFVLGQSVGLSLHTGFDSKRNFNIGLFPLNDTIVNSRITFEKRGSFINQIGLNFYRPDYSSYEIALGYNGGTIVLFPIPEATFDSTIAINNNIAEFVTRNISLSFSRFIPFAARNERVKIFWGYGIDAFFNYSDIENIKANNLFRNRRRNTGIGTNFLSKVVFQTKKKRFLLEGIFGINVLDFGVDDTKKFDPNLTLRQQTSFFYNLDIPLSPNWRFGVVYLFNPIVKKDTTEKTQ